MDVNVEVVKHLESELQSNRVRNPSYSLRTFSKRIGVVPSALSELMHGKRRVTRKMAYRILSALNVGPQELDQLLSKIESPSRKKEVRIHKKPKNSSDYTQLNLSRIYVVLDWYYFAIVSLAQTRNFKEDPRWIAERLGISPTTAGNAVRRLEQVGLLVRNKKGKIRYASSNFATPSDIPDYAIRKRHHQHLELAMASLENDDVFERDFSTMTIATTREKLKEAKEKIKQFRRSLSAFLESDEKEEVFLLNIQFFPLTKKASADR